jgi:PAS domain S-box-containing protein
MTPLHPPGLAATPNEVEITALRIFEFSPDLLGSANEAGYFTALNPAWERTLGFTVEELMSQPFTEWVHPGDREATVAEMARLEAEGVGRERFQNRYAVKSGGWCWLSWQVGVSEETYYFTARNVTKEVEAEHRTHLAASLVEGIDDAIVTTTTDGVITSWNHASEDTYGFAAEEVIGRPLAGLVVPHEHREGPIAIIGRLLEGQGVRQYTANWRHRDGRELTVSLTASLLRDESHKVLGVVVVSRDISQLGLEDLQVRSEMDSLVWVGRIRDAIDEGRICFYGQPIVSLSGVVRSYELLCRMLDRDGNVILPAHFLPAAENYGLIEELDLLAIEEAARQMAAGHPMSMNLSPRSVGRRHFVDVVAEKLRDAEADPSLLTIEITETGLMKNIANAERFARAVSKLGCRVALDDFGTGFGGFTYLKRLQIDELKIDVEFIRDLGANHASEHVVRAVVSLAQALGLDTVAEGVEDADTLALLAGYRVTHAQGYHFAAPGPLSEILGAPVGPFAAAAGSGR